MLKSQISRDVINAATSKIHCRLKMFTRIETKHVRHQFLVKNANEIINTFESLKVQFTAEFSSTSESVNYGR